MQAEFDFIFNSEYLLADSILLNIVIRGGDVALALDTQNNACIGDYQIKRIIQKDFALLCQAMIDRSLLSGESRNFLLARAAREENLKFCKLLVEQGADVNYVIPKFLRSVLMLACSSGELETVKFIVSSGADLNHVNGVGRNALRSKGASEIFNYLLASGINFKQVGVNDVTILQSVAYFKSFDKYQKLLDLGINSSLRNDAGKTAIDIVFDNQLNQGDNDATNLKIEIVLQKFKDLRPRHRLEQEIKIIETIFAAILIG